MLAPAENAPKRPTPPHLCSSHAPGLVWGCKRCYATAHQRLCKRKACGQWHLEHECCPFDQQTKAEKAKRRAGW